MADDEESLRNLKRLIEILTHSGLNHLDKELMADIRKLCRKSDYMVQQAYITVVRQLRKSHAQVRYIAFLLCIELFNRSHIFRESVIKNLQMIVQLTTENDLPEPRDVRAKLRQLALKSIAEWTEKYGGAFKELQLCYNYLKNCKNVDFENIRQEAVEDQAHRELLERQQGVIRSEKTEKLEKEIEEVIPEIECVITSVKNCISLLIPPPDEFFIPLENDSENFSNINSEESNLRSFGVQPSYSLSLNLNLNRVEIEKTEENAMVIENLLDHLRLIKKRFEPKISNWINICTKYEISGILKRLIDIKEKLKRAQEKFEEIEIKGLKEEDSSDEEDLVEVPTKEGFEPEVIEPEPSVSQITEKEKSLKDIAPKVPFDIDLYHWEDDDLKAPTLLSTNMDYPKFWSSSGAEDLSEIPVPGGISHLRTRVIEFTGKFHPVKWTCRVKLPSGRLCPRQDRVKCPFHGPIVERDEQGRPINDREVEKKKDEVPDWQDPQLLAELKAATGIDLKMPDKKKKKRRKKGVLEEVAKRNLPGIVDIKKTNTVRSRLHKKIFNKSSLKRVAADVSKLEYRRHREKFNDQFNYVHNTS